VAGFVEVDAATVEALRGAVRQIGGVATNINQIAKAANRTRDPDFSAFMEERAALGRDLARIE
ncbi:MAG: endonuclease, partial [Rhodobacterales bacterium CG18_big_fil_WC_8_21_14_2_50_71_9]